LYTYEVSYNLIIDNDNEALEYVMQQVNCGKINLGENRIQVLHRSIDDVD